jgi:endonuclease/exonuclease/phosphatase (EEP) superfamily protein YafD
MALTRTESGLCVANLHVSTKPSSAERELLDGAGHATDFAGSHPLVFGGDFNVRPKASKVFEQLEERYGLAPPTAPDRLSHLLVRGLDVVEHPTALPPGARDVIDPQSALRIRLSDHNPVVGEFSVVE